MKSIILALTFLIGQPAPGQIFTKQEASKQHTSVRLIADVRSIAPGGHFTVGVLMHMDKGWHTYWKNSGEAGLPTTVDWTLPAGIQAGEIQWPVPTKHIEEGDVLTYGYADEVMLLVPFTISSKYSASTPVVLRAKIEWLECESICVPGSANVSLKLPVSPGKAEPDNAALFEKYRQLVPGPLSTNSGISTRNEYQGNTLVIHLSAQAGGPLAFEGAPDFYPEPITSVTFGRTAVATEAGGSALRISMSASEKLTAPATLKGILVYRSADEEQRTAALEIPLSAEFMAGLRPPGEAQQSGSILDQQFVTTQAGTSQSLLLYLFFALVGGLLLNIMPCVLPVIALKVFGLVRMAADEPKQIRRLGWMFSVGILASFLVLALVVILLQTAGQQVGWGFQFQEPLFVIAMSVVVFAFGLSLFDVFEIRLPGVAVTGVSAAVARQTSAGKGYAASFWEGVFATILATPCTAPFLGTALGFAFAQPWWTILLIFTVVAFGMALPYLLLTSKPAWVKYLPKPGEWMVTAKQFMGFLMMATLIWLLYILGKQLGMEGVVWTAAFLLTVGIACWLIGRFATLTASRRKTFITWGLAVLVVVAGYWIFLESILDVRNVIAGTSAQTGPSGTSAEGIAWKGFSLQGLESDLKENKLVFVDFTAEWCLTCKVNEKSVLADQDVVGLFKSLNVTAIRADWTNRNPDITRLLQKFGRSGVPLYVIFPPGKPNAPIILPEVVTTGIVTEALRRAAGGGPNS